MEWDAEVRERNEHRRFRAGMGRWLPGRAFLVAIFFSTLLIGIAITASGPAVGRLTTTPATPTIAAPNLTLAVIFADNRLAKKRGQLEKDLAELHIFDEVMCFDEERLGPEFWQKHGTFVRHSRGFGYWIWKPWILLKAFERCNEGDVVLYMDVGCVLNTKARDRLHEYINMVRGAENGLLAFRLTHAERYYTKGRVLRLFGCNNTCSNANQIMATAFVIKKTRLNQELVEKWYDTVTRDNYINVNDGLENEDPEFRTPRHDQSVWSMLVKSRPPDSVIVLDDETYPSDDRYPIWAVRQKY